MRVCAYLLLAFIAGFPVETARADESWDFVQIVCIPEMQFFSLQTVSIENPPSEYFSGKRIEQDGSIASDDAEESVLVARLEKQYGLYLTEELEARPYRCKFRQLSRRDPHFEILVSSQYREPLGHGPNGFEPYVGVSVHVNGVEVGKMAQSSPLTVDGEEAALAVTVTGNSVGTDVRSCVIGHTHFSASKTFDSKGVKTFDFGGPASPKTECHEFEFR